MNNQSLWLKISILNYRDAANLLRRLRDDIEPLKITAEYARIQPICPRLTSHDLDFLNDRPAIDDSEKPIRNVLELSKRFVFMMMIIVDDDDVMQHLF